MPNAPSVDPEALLDLIRSRRSIRQYRSKPVPEHMLEQVLEAGRWAPSASNQQPWAFVVVRDKQLVELVAQHSAYYMEQEARIEDAPVLIVLCGVVWSQSRRRSLRGDVGMAGMQMMLQAHALGLGTCWVDGLDRQAIADRLGIPSELEIVGVITLGFPATEPAPTTRKSLFDIVHYDVWEGVDFGGMADGDEFP